MSSSVQALLKSTGTPNPQVKGRASEGDAEAFQAELGKAASRVRKPEPADDPKPAKVSRSKKADQAGQQQDDQAPVEAAGPAEPKPVEPTADEPVAVEDTEPAEPVEAEADADKPAAKSDTDAAALAVAVPGVMTPTAEIVATDAAGEAESQEAAAAKAIVTPATPNTDAADADPQNAAAGAGEIPIPEELTPDAQTTAAAPKAKPELKQPEAEAAPETQVVAQQPPAEEKSADTKASAKLESPATEVQPAAIKSHTDVAPTAKPQAAQPPEVKFAQDNHDSIVKGVQTQLLPRGGTMTIRLDPPELGALNVILSIKDGIATASFTTSNEQATQLLSHSLSQLKSAMESTGVTVDKIQVQQAPKNQDSQSSRDDNQQRGQGGGDEMARQQEQQRKEMLRRMWRRLSIGSDPLDMVA